MDGFSLVEVNPVLVLLVLPFYESICEFQVYRLWDEDGLHENGFNFIIKALKNVYINIQN